MVSVLVAGAGVYLHSEEDEDDRETAGAVETGAKEKEKPPLAPIAFAGLAAAGLLATSRKWPAEVV